MKELLLMSVLFYMFISASQLLEARSLRAGSPEKPDLVEKADDNNGFWRTHDPMNIAQGTGSKRVTTRSASQISHREARGGGALIPVYAGAANKNRHRSAQHSGCSQDRLSCCGSRILLITTVLISFCILI